MKRVTIHATASPVFVTARPCSLYIDAQFPEKNMLEMERWDGVHNAVMCEETGGTSCTKESESALRVATALPLHFGPYQGGDYSGSAASEAVPKWQPRPSPQTATEFTGLTLPEAAVATATVNGALARVRVPVVDVARHDAARFVPSAVAILLAPLPARAVPAVQRNNASDVAGRARVYRPLSAVASSAASRDTHRCPRAPNEKRGADMGELVLPSERDAVRILQQLARLQTPPRSTNAPSALHADVLEYALFFSLLCYSFFFLFSPSCVILSFFSFSLLCYLSVRVWRSY